ncbi:aldo/keto reductase [Streptoalloteichus hindustanus]|uniref:Predicted oxidoreductase n=1 Tax=Streptoalloteichus hindustanus TaxID=2017 RepID=A0A1M5HZP6_STRHI|nr:aldo/keto reductase [Streptoalloteichus hindustanus]SHG21352.1 Predicted oxidoreductase [Streptoalloteichus hindustanus]
MRYSHIDGVPTPVSRCVLGTSGIRGVEKHALLDAFFEAGGTCIDTARAYGGGASEEAVGAWIARARPERLVVLAKGAHPPHCTPEAVGVELTRTLEALGVECADVYLLHRDDTSVPVGEFVDALEREVAAGRVRVYGGSNWESERLAEATAYARARGGRGMVAVSNHFSLAEPVEPLYPGCVAVSARQREYLAAHNVALFPWSSQARGFFADVPRESLDPNVWRCWDTEENRARRERARQLAATLGVRAINVALAYVLHQPFPTFPIVGPQTVAELRLASRGVAVELDAAQVRWLETGR